MNAETLDRLMMDRALGGLPPDAEELLEAWLAEKPAAQGAADEIEETIGLARTALREEARVKSNVIHLPTKRKIRRARALAACFAGGLLLGAVLHHQPEAAPPVIAASAPASQQLIQNIEEPSSLWSLARLRGNSAPVKRSVVWISPVRKPRLF